MRSQCYSHHQVLMDTLKEHFGTEKEVVGIEIGTNCGDSARSILWALPNCKMLYTVDPWLHIPGKQFESGNQQEYHDKNKALAYPRLYCDEFAGRVEIFEMTSCSAYEVLQARGVEKLDFVWIDGSHEEDDVRNDIQMFLPMIREGGIIGGHDFGQVPEVTKVVFETFSGKVWSGYDFAWWSYR